MKDFLTSFTGFTTRYYKSASGRESSKWLMAQIQEIADTVQYDENIQVQVTEFPHPWGQVNIIYYMNFRVAFSLHML